jgi:hypothetical protein
VFRRGIAVATRAGMRAALLALVFTAGCFGNSERVDTHIVVHAEGDDPAAAEVTLHADAFWRPRCLGHGCNDGEGGRLEGLVLEAGGSAGELVGLAEPEPGRYFGTTTGYSTEYAIAIDGGDAYVQLAPEYFTAEATYDRATGKALVTFSPPIARRDDPRNEDLDITVYQPDGRWASRCNVEPVYEGDVIEVPECLLTVPGEHTLVIERHVYDGVYQGIHSTAEITVVRRLTLVVPLPSAPSPRPAAP